jgi:O-antigen/teichoic acid export membrane protein
VVLSAATQLTIVLVAGQLGAGDLGGIRAVDVVFAPMTLIGEAFAFPGVPIVARALARSVADARRWAWRLSAAASLLVGAYLALAAPFSRQILSRLFGPEFAVFTAIVIPIAVAQLVRALAIGFAILLQSDRRVHAITVSRGITTGLALVLGPTLAARHGLVPAVWGMEIGFMLGSIATIVCGLMPRDIPLLRRARAR